MQRFPENALLGLGLLIYATLFRFYLRLQLQLFPKLNEQFEQMLKRMEAKDEWKAPTGPKSPNFSATNAADRLKCPPS